MKNKSLIIFDFDGVFTNNKVYVGQDGAEMVLCDRGDGLGLNFLNSAKKNGMINARWMILSKEKNPVVVARANKLGIDCHHGVHNKLVFVQEIITRDPDSFPNGMDDIIYLGNDLNDLPVMRRVGFSVAPADAHPLIRKVAHLNLTKCGGDGFVREFVEWFLGFHHWTEEQIHEFVSNC
jgi:YrbI family 3-deoxy-D-manno-octulosonate 8-phosphate phosphatase